MGFQCPGRRWLPAVLFLGFLAPNAFAGCPPYLCNLATDGAYDKIVIGTLVHIASDEELARAVCWAKQRGYWQQLPNSVAPYLKYIKLVAIAPDDDYEPMALFMMQREYEAAPLHVVVSGAIHAPLAAVGGTESPQSKSAFLWPDRVCSYPLQKVGHGVSAQLQKRSVQPARPANKPRDRQDAVRRHYYRPGFNAPGGGAVMDLPND